MLSKKLLCCGILTSSVSEIIELESIEGLGKVSAITVFTFCSSFFLLQE